MRRQRGAVAKSSSPGRTGLTSGYGMRFAPEKVVPSGNQSPGCFVLGPVGASLLASSGWGSPFTTSKGVAATRRDASRDGDHGVVEPSDEHLMLAFRDGESEGLEVLFDRYAGRIEALVMRFTGNLALARDITQTTFLSVVKGRGRYVDGCRFRPWLYTIAMNALRDHLRRTKRELLVPNGGPLLDGGLHRDQHRDPGLQRVLLTALGELPPEQREAVVLHQLEGFSFDEVAEILGCSRSAAKVRAHRGYRRLREQLHDTWEEDT